MSKGFEFVLLSLKKIGYLDRSPSKENSAKSFFDGRKRLVSESLDDSDPLMRSMGIFCNTKGKPP
jgi:hypothetical protein